MATLVIKTFPEDLHEKLKEAANEHRRSVTQQAIVYLERALDQENAAPPKAYWKNRQLVQDFAEAIEKGAFSEGPDSTDAISEERDQS